MKPFSATCQMYDPTADRLRLTQEEYDAHKASGAHGRATFDYGTKMWNVEQRCSFSTADVTELRAHLEAVHANKKRVMALIRGKAAPTFVRINSLLPQRPMHPKWRGPALKAEGQPFKTKVEGIETCGTCGLVAEVGNRAADVLWWDEHQRLCAGAESAVA
jgi:hypothetical protein